MKKVSILIEDKNDYFFFGNFTNKEKLKVEKLAHNITVKSTIPYLEEYLYTEDELIRSSATVDLAEVDFKFEHLHSYIMEMYFKLNKNAKLTDCHFKLVKSNGLFHFINQAKHEFGENFTLNYLPDFQKHWDKDVKILNKKYKNNLNLNKTEIVTHINQGYECYDGTDVSKVIMLFNK